MSWTPHEPALRLLEDAGPFEHSMFRRAVLDTTEGVTDLSFGARAADGTEAAIALLGDRYLAECVPPEGYGDIRAGRPLTSSEARSFLRAARRAAGARQLWLRTVVLCDGQGPDWSFARSLGTASVIPVSAGAAPATRYARLTKRSLRKARDAGAEALTTTDADAFLALYAEASASWSKRYPHELIRRLGELGVARFDMVVVDAEPVAGLMTLTGTDHWMCWLAAQNSVGRDVAASYVAYDRLLTDAASHVAHVSLGASARGTGGEEFKRRLGAGARPFLAVEQRGVVARLGEVRSGLRDR